MSLLAGIAPDGSDVTMEWVNVHSGVDPEDNNGLHNRGSAGCPTYHPDDSDDFFNNFDLVMALPEMHQEQLLSLEEIVQKRQKQKNYYFLNRSYKRWILRLGLDKMPQE